MSVQQESGGHVSTLFSAKRGREGGAWASALIKPQLADSP
jgi:hypothetical protein